MSIHESKRIRSDSDGLSLDLLIVRPEDEPRGLVQFSHGMCEHKERYIPFMEYLANEGFACVISDHRGHGASVLSERDLGYFYENGAKYLVNDLHQITCLMRNRWPDKKLILFGHSMGSLAVRVYTGLYDRDIDGLVVCGSPGRNPAVNIGLALNHVLTAICGPRHRSAIMYAMSLGPYERRYKKEGKTAWLSASKQNREAYENDPLCSFRFTLNGYNALLHLLRGAYSLPSAKHPDLPIRFYSGTGDPCAPDERGFLDAISKMYDAGYTNVEGHMFEGLRHEILREDNNSHVFERIFTEAILPVINP